MLAAALSALALLSATGGPTNKTLPSVVGTARAGSQVTGTSGTWSGSGTISYTYHWDRCDASGNNCAAISGAALPTYLLTTADVGKTVGLDVTAKDANGTTTVDSSLVGPVAASGALASIGRPTIAVSGSTVTVSGGVWTTTPTALAYEWLRCNTSGRACTAIAGAAKAAYTATSPDAGHTLVARVQATAGSVSQVVLSIATAVVAGASTTTTTTTTTTTSATTTTTTTTASSGPPTVTGIAKVGAKLTGTAPAGATFQWHRCDLTGAHCTSIHGATKATYTSVAADADHTIGLTVTVSGAASYAPLFGPVAAKTATASSTVQPAVTGKAVQGQTLTASQGTWNQAPTSVTYAWQRCNANGRLCSPIAGATTSTYVPVGDDLGHEILAIISATIGNVTQSAFSLPSGAVVAPPVLAATVAPAVTGTIQVGAQLTGANGTWAGTAPITYHDQWYRCDATGAHCFSIHGATAATYRLVAADVGKTIGLTVTATDATSAKQAAYSALVGPVAAKTAKLISTTRPPVTVSGQAVTVGPGAWSTTPGSTTVQWERCNANGRVCTAISGATSVTYTATSADAGHMLLALITAHSGSTTATALSAAVKAP